MLKKYSVLQGFVILCVGLLVFCLPPLQAQDSDFVTWNKMKAPTVYLIQCVTGTHLDISVKFHFGGYIVPGFGVGTSVLLLPFLKAEGGYEYHYRNRGEDGWKSRHRYHAGVSFTLKKRQWTFTLRERFQHTFDGRGADEFRLRTRLKAAYKVTTWSPYVSLEQYHGLGKDEWFHASRFRARGGVEAKLSSSWSADIFYCYQHESDLDRHILGWELIYRF